MMWDSEVASFHGAAGKLTAVRVRHRVLGNTSDVPIDGAFVAIGHSPNTEMFRGQMELSRRTGHIK